jgi:hypothetical protein
VQHGYALTGLHNLSVLTTADVPFQQRGCNIPTLYFLLPIACQRLIGRNLPPELVTLIISFASLGMSREIAEQHRRALMDDRMPRGGKSTWDEVSLAAVVSPIGDSIESTI